MRRRTLVLVEPYDEAKACPVEVLELRAPVPLAEQRGDVVVAEPVVIERFDGMRAHLIASTAQIKDDEGRIIGAAAVYLDVTERHEAEREREHLVLSLEFERSRLGALLQKTLALIATLRGDDLFSRS